MLNSQVGAMSEHNQKLKEVVEALEERFEAGVYEYREEVSLVVRPDQIVEACQVLRDEFNFELLAAQTAVDYWPEQTPRFHVVYQIRSYQRNVVIGLRVPLDGKAPEIPSIEGVYRNANWYERELWDLFGIKVEDHPDLRRILMPHDWEGHPLRKDFPLGYEEVQFSFNFDEIDERKPYVKE